jgi:hypothetical protein
MAEIVRIAIPKTEELGPKCSTLLCDANGLIYVAGHDTIYTVDHTNTLTRYAGSATLEVGDKNGPRLEALFNDIMDLCWLSPGRMLVCSYQERRIRLIENDMVGPFVGSGMEASKDGDFDNASFSAPIAIACLDPDHLVVVAELVAGIRLINLRDKRVTTITPEGHASFGSFRWWGICPSINPDSCIIGSSNTIVELNVRTSASKKLAMGSKIYDVRCVTQTADGRVIFCNTEKNSICEIIAEDEIKMIPETSGLDIRLPTHVIVAPNGDLWWTEYSGLVRKVAGTKFHPYMPWYSNKKEQQFCSDFSELFGEISQNMAENPVRAFLDLDVIHTASGNTLAFSKALIRAIHIDPDILAQVCGSSALPFDVLQECLLLATGCSLPDVRANPKIWMSAIHLWTKLGCTPIATWLEAILCTQNFKISKQDSLGTYLKEAAGIDSDQPPCLDSLQYYLSQASEEKSEVKPLPPCFIIGPDPNSNPNPWAYVKSCISELWTGDKGASSTDFSISCSGGLMSSQFHHVHKWVLYSRWLYFKRLISSGFAETETGKAELPSDFPAPLLTIFLNYLYCETLPDTSKSEMTSELAQYVIENASQYHWMDMDGEVHRSFKGWITFCQSLIV